MGIAGGNVQYSYAQLEGIWQQAGGSAQTAPMAAAIAMAESGGNSAAYDQDSNGSIDRGLWQINSVHGSQSSYDVMTNARAAIAISNNGTNWRPWCTAYSDGACGTNGGVYLGSGAPYQRYLQGGVPPDLNAPINATNAAANTTSTQGSLTSGGCSFWEQLIAPELCLSNDITGGAENAVAGTIINALVGSLLNPLIQLVAGVMGITGGSVLMISGLYLIVKQTQAYQQTSQGVSTLKNAAEPQQRLMGGQQQQQPQLTPDQQRQSRAASTELQRRQNQQAKQMSTQDLLKQEALRYGKVVAE